MKLDTTILATSVILAAKVAALPVQPADDELQTNHVSRAYSELVTVPTAGNEPMPEAGIIIRGATETET